MKQKWSTLLALLLVCVLVVALPFGAWAVNLQTPGNITLKVSEEYADLTSGNVAIDLYQVAAAEEVAGVDSYTFINMEDGPFADLELPADPDNEAWAVLAQQAAAVLKEALADETVTLKPAATVALKEKTGDLKPGLYLTVVHAPEGFTVDDFITTRGADGEDVLVTLIETDEQEYTFQPMLVALPSRELIVDGESSNNTANATDWQFDVTALLKPGMAPRFGQVEITKELTGYVKDQQIMFIFQVTATDDSGKVVFDQLVTMVIRNGTSATSLVENIPAGSKVTVKEIYAGAGYEFVGMDPVMDPSLEGYPEEGFTVRVGETLKVRVVNKPGPNHSGGGIENKFEYHNGGWYYDNSNSTNPQNKPGNMPQA